MNTKRTRTKYQHCVVGINKNLIAADFLLNECSDQECYDTARQWAEDHGDVEDAFIIFADVDSCFLALNRNMFDGLDNKLWRRVKVKKIEH